MSTQQDMERMPGVEPHSNVVVGTLSRRWKKHRQKRRQRRSNMASIEFLEFFRLVADSLKLKLLRILETANVMDWAIS
jgi:hypothetical protein